MFRWVYITGDIGICHLDQLFDPFEIEILQNLKKPLKST